MKILIQICSVILFTAMLIVVNGCSDSFNEEVRLQEDTCFEMQKYIESAYMMREYLLLEDNRYVLDISKYDAIEIGVSGLHYDKMVMEIEVVNAQIAIWESMPSVSYALTDPRNIANEVKAHDIEWNLPLLKTRDEFVPVPDPELKGNISTLGQEYGEAKFKMPTYNLNSIDFSCISNAALVPVYNVMIEVNGHSKTGSAIGVIGKLTEINVSMPEPESYLIGDEVTVKFRTSDSNGGKCGWEGIYKKFVR
jgi:hypothetical protein